MNEKKMRIVPYDRVSPGFEAVYTGQKSTAEEGEEGAGPATLITDDEGNVIQKWSTWTWTWPGQEVGWGDEIKVINDMQAKLGPLDDGARQIRAHIGSLVPCDSGFPVTVDELLDAIGKGKLREPSFHNGCWHCGVWWDTVGTQPRQIESMGKVQAILTGYLAGEAEDDMEARFPDAAGFINRAYRWLGPATELTQLQKLMLERMLLPFEFFTQQSHSDPGAWPDDAGQLGEAIMENCFGESGRGAQLDAEIEALAGLPNLNAAWPDEYREALDSISDPKKRELYEICRSIRDGLHTLADCHHSAFRYIENWIHGIGTGKSIIATRRKGAEKERLGRLLFGYALGLDKWLQGKPMQFLLLDLGHVELDLGFDPKNEILRVYAYLGEERTPLKEWLAACLWHSLAYHSIMGNRAGLVRHEDLLERAREAGISVREWMDSVLGTSGAGRAAEEVDR